MQLGDAAEPTRSTSTHAAPRSRAEVQPVHYASEPVRTREPLSTARPAAFRFTEMRHTSSIPVHAHAAATVTILLGGAYGESYPGPGRTRQLEFCSSSVLLRPGGIEHANRVGVVGAHSLVVEVGAERLDELREYTRVFDGITFRRGAALEGLARRMQREVSRPDAAALLALSR
jgi:hypothetical protein